MVGNPEEIFKNWLSEVHSDLKRRGAFWSPTLVTNPLRARTVVLRALEFYDSKSMRLPRFIVHTDIRSPKWQNLQENNEGSLHFYCPKRKWQVIVNFRANLSHRDPDATIEWKRLSESSQKIYSLPYTPGKIITNPQDAYIFEDLPTKDQNFGVLTLTPTSIESLQLETPERSQLHVRALWDLQKVTFNYLAP